VPVMEPARRGSPDSSATKTTQRPATPRPNRRGGRLGDAETGATPKPGQLGEPARLGDQGDAETRALIKQRDTGPRPHSRTGVRC
jgi:hypothetical protein